MLRRPVLQPVREAAARPRGCIELWLALVELPQFSPIGVAQFSPLAAVALP